MKATRAGTWVGQWATPAPALGIFRILYAGGLLIVWPPLSSVPLGGAPGSFYFAPLGPMAVLTGYPPSWLLLILEMACRSALIPLALGWRTRVVSIVVGVGFTLLAGVRYSTGKIDHDLLVLTVAPLALAAYWGASLSMDALRRPTQPVRDSAPGVAVLALATGFLFFTSGLAKALTGWLATDGSATRGWMLDYVDAGLGHWLNEAVITWDVPLLWKALDVTTVLFEMGFLVAIWRRRWLRFYVPVALAFHIGTIMLMSIDFSRLSLIYLLLAAPGVLAAPRLTRPVERAFTFLSRWRVVALPLGMGLVAAAFWASGPRSLGALFPAPPANLGMVVLVIALAVALLALRCRQPFGAAPWRVPRWAAPTALLVLVVPLPLFWTYSEVYPSVTGPLFMGNGDRGTGIVVNRQVFYRDGEEVTATEALRLPEPYATNVGEMRFPLHRDGSGRDRIEELRSQGHSFSPLAYHPAPYVRLRADETQWLGDPVELRVEWLAVLYDEAGVEQSAVPVTTYRLRSGSAPG